MSLKFNPPPEQIKKMPRYASYAAGVMKTHGGIGFAKNSLNNRMWQRVNGKRVTTYAAILENIGGDWYTLYEINEGSEYKDLPWVQQQFYAHGGWTTLTDYYRNNSYYGPKLANGDYRVSYRSIPMTTDEYVKFRIAVEHERMGLFPHTFREVSVPLDDEV